MVGKPYPQNIFYVSYPFRRHKENKKGTFLWQIWSGFCPFPHPASVASEFLLSQSPFLNHNCSFASLYYRIKCVFFFSSPYFLCIICFAILYYFIFMLQHFNIFLQYLHPYAKIFPHGTALLQHNTAVVSHNVTLVQYHITLLQYCQKIVQLSLHYSAALLAGCEVPSMELAQLCLYLQPVTNTDCQQCNIVTVLQCYIVTVTVLHCYSVAV